MKTRALILASLVAAGVTACKIDNNMSIEPVGVCAFPSDAEACELPAECDAYLTGRSAVFYLSIYTEGVVDNELELWMEFRNQLPNNADASAFRVNTNDAVIETYKISYDAPGLTIPSIEVGPISQTIPADGSSSASVPVIPFEIATALGVAMANGSAQIVTARVAVAGHYTNGDRFETGEFQIPVSVADFVFPGYFCPVGEHLTFVCPNYAQTSSWNCEADE